MTALAEKPGKAERVIPNAPWPVMPFGEIVDILDSRRVPVNSSERAKRHGDVPYFGATGQVGWIDEALFDEELVLLGEDGAPFLDPAKPKAYLVRGRAWVNNHAHVLRGKQGLLNSFLLYQLNHIDYHPYVSGSTRMSYGDYVEQLTFLLFRKMADEQSRAPFNKPSPIPKGFGWDKLVKLDGDDLEVHYRHTLEELGRRTGMLGTIFRKAQNKIQDPSKLRRLVVDLIDKETWTMLDADVKGDAYEGLLEKNAADVKGGAGQYFTPRALISAMVEVMAPKPGQTICDPACGTGGFLLAAHDYLAKLPGLDRAQKKALKSGTFYGIELVDSVTRLCAMNMLLHGIGGESDTTDLPVVTKDALASKHDEYDMVLANPPFGKKSSVTITNEEGEISKESLTINRDDFWATTSNKQLNFLQHIFTILKQHGRAAVVLPDNVLFEGGAGETIRRQLLQQADVHTLLRLPTGIFYAQGVKANVLFFDRKPAADKKAWTEKLWIYDLRTNQHFTLKENTLKRSDLDDFVACYFGNVGSSLADGPRHAGKRQPYNDRHHRVETERFKAFTYDELIKRDKVNLDLFWLKDEALEDSANLPAPDVIATEIVQDLEAALEQFREIEADLKP